VKEARAGRATEHGRADYENPSEGDATLQLSSIVEAINLHGHRTLVEVLISDLAKRRSRTNGV
jgi:hypothetical protein